MTASEITIRDVDYLTLDNVVLRARIYQPLASGLHRGLISVHGGAWTMGDRLLHATVDETLARHGIFVLAIDFRMPPVGRYPDTVADVNFAIRWLKSRATEYRIHSSPLGIFGISSGGHLAMLTAMRPQFPTYAAHALGGNTDVDAAVDYVVLGMPVLDPLARYRYAAETNREGLIQAHNAFWQTKEAMIEGNPQLILDRSDPARLPPVLLIQGTADENVPIDIPRRFARAYRDAGGEIRVDWYEQMPHGFLMDSERPETVAAISSVVDFVTARESSPASHRHP